MKLWTKKLLLLIVAFVIFLLLLEIVLRAAYPLYANYNTEMWRYSMNLKKITGPFLFEHIPNKSVELYGVNIKTNSQGWRDLEDFSEDSNATKILLLGDSITLGWGVEYNQTYPQLIEQELKKRGNFEVINLGVGNYNTRLELESFKRNLNLKPALIVLGYYINDIEQVSPARPFFGFSYIYMFFWDRLTRIKYQRMNNLENYYTSLYSNESLINETRQYLEEIINLSKVPVIIANIPEFHQFEDYPFGYVGEFLKGVAEQNPKVHYIDLLPLFVNFTPQEIWVSAEDPHPNALGHMLIARQISEYIDGMVPKII
jgi:lysophospholipase L1-like esterase